MGLEKSRNIGLGEAFHVAQEGAILVSKSANSFFVIDIINLDNLSSDWSLPNKVAILFMLCSLLKNLMSSN